MKLRLYTYHLLKKNNECRDEKGYQESRKKRNPLYHCHIPVSKTTVFWLQTHIKKYKNQKKEVGK